MACTQNSPTVALSIASGVLRADAIVSAPVATAPPNLLVAASDGLLVPTDGWVALPAALAYSATTDGMYVCTSSVDLRAYVGVGARIRLTHAGVTKYFVVAAVAAGTLSLYGGGTYTLAAGPISAPFFSTGRAPALMPQFDYAVTTVAEANALFGGAPPHGAQVTLRQGASPYRFLSLTYDATWAKWVSAPISCGAASIGGINSAAATPPTGVSAGVFDYGPWITAGLTLQARWAGFLTTSDNTKTHYGGIYVQGITQANPAGTGATTLAELGGTATSFYVASDWTDVASLGASYELASATIYTRDQGTGDLAATYGAVETRWRS